MSRMSQVAKNLFAISVFSSIGSDESRQIRFVLVCEKKY